MATMYGKPVVYINGKPLAPATAAAVLSLDRAFHKRWGLHLVVNSGLRTPQYQDQLNAAWEAYKAGRGPKASYALRSTDPQAYHVITNPKGGKSVDLGDTGSDPGVATGYNARANWIRQEAPKHGLEPRGYTFGEPWHFELIGDPWATISGGSVPAGTSTPSITTDLVEEEDEDMAVNSGFYWMNGKKQLNVIVNFGSGAFHEYEASGDYNNGIASAFQTTDFAKITKSHRDALEQDCAKIRQGK